MVIRVTDDLLCLFGRSALIASWVQNCSGNLILMTVIHVASLQLLSLLKKSFVICKCGKNKFLALHVEIFNSTYFCLHTC